MARKRLNLNIVRANSEEEQAAIMERVYELSRQVPKPTVEQIASSINRSVAMVKIYRQKLIAQGRLERTESGRVKVSKKAIEAANYQEIIRSDFVANYPSVLKWVEKMKQGGKLGNGVIGYDKLLNSFYVVCRTLQVTPDAFLISDEQTQELMERFKVLFKEGKAKSIRITKLRLRSGEKTSVHNYAKAVANFCFRNGRPLPKNMDGALSRKKEGFGAYSTVQLSDQVLNGLLDFLRDHPEGGPDFEALAALHHELIPRTKTMLRWKNNLQFKTMTIDGVTCHYAIAPSVYESKTHKSFDKMILEPRTLEIARRLKPNETIVKFESVQLLTKKYNALIREYYAKIGLIDKESLNNLQNYYKKVEDGERYYLWMSPNYALRHSGCHAWARRCQYNATMIMSLGWDDPNMITQVYGKMDNEFRLKAGACLYCNPEGLQGDEGNKIFCSWNHALVFFNNGGKTKAVTLEERKKQEAEKLENALSKIDNIEPVLTTIPQIETPGAAA